MKSVKAVILLTPGFPKNEQDTTCLPYLQDFVISFSQVYLHIKLLVITFQQPYKRGIYFWNGVEVYSAGGNDSKYFFRLLTWFRAIKQVWQYKKKYDITVIHGFWLTECTLIGQWVAKFLPVKYIAYAIGQDVTKQNRYLKFLNFSKMQLVATSKFVADKFYETTGRTINNVIPFGINENKLSSKINKAIDVLGVGALIPLKNYLLFIYIINQLKQDFPHLKSCIVGGGEQKELLVQMINEHKLQDNISLTGELPHAEIFNYMAASKIFLHTSSYEGQSTVIMEALASGLPVVCFNVGRLHSDNKINVCNDKNEMIVKLKKLLTSNISYEPLVQRKMDDTARDFMKLYEH